jgi:hypothetical protein
MRRGSGRPKRAAHAGVLRAVVIIEVPGGCITHLGHTVDRGASHAPNFATAGLPQLQETPCIQRVGYPGVPRGARRAVQCRVALPRSARSAASIGTGQARSRTAARGRKGMQAWQGCAGNGRSGHLVASCACWASCPRPSRNSQWCQLGGRSGTSRGLSVGRVIHSGDSAPQSSEGGARCAVSNAASAPGFGAGARLSVLLMCIGGWWPPSPPWSRRDASPRARRSRRRSAPTVTPHDRRGEPGRRDDFDRRPAHRPRRSPCGCMPRRG